MTPFALAHEFHRAGILREHFKQIPDEYLAFPEKGTRDVRIRCVCGSESDLSFGQIKTCDCGRLFWAGSKVYAAPPAPDEEHDHTAARFTLRTGVTVLADYCATCGCDVG